MCCVFLFMLTVLKRTFWLPTVPLMIFSFHPASTPKVCHETMAALHLPPGFTWKDINKKKSLDKFKVKRDVSFLCH